MKHKKLNMYRAGDKVLVREDLTEWEYYQHGDGTANFAGQPMVKFAGKVVTIKSGRSDYNHYHVEELAGWAWTDDMFVGFADCTERNFDTSILLSLL